MIIRISDEDGCGRPKTENFIGGRYSVISRAGLNTGEAFLLESLCAIAGARNILLVENRTGAAGIAAADFFPGAPVVFHNLDLSQAGNIRRNLVRNGCPLETRWAPYLAEKETCDAVFLLCREHMPKELAADLLQQAHQALKKGGKCVAAIEGADRAPETEMEKTFGGVTRGAHTRAGRLLIAKKKGELRKVRRFEAEFTMTAHGRQDVRLATIPGVFSHRRVDQGALALAETAEALPGDAMLDMGCGCGAVGISIAKSQELARACFVDSCSRAVHITERNCRANGLDRAEVLLSDAGIVEKEGFTLFVGNPPYFLHYRIAELFIRAAHRVLKAGGRAYIVAKSAQWHGGFMRELFYNAEVLSRRGYQIVKSIK